MSRKILLLAFAMIWVLILGAQEADIDSEIAEPTLEELQSQIHAVSDSLVEMRESAILSDYGIKVTDKLKDVAEKLEIQDIVRWKSYLEIEPENETLDEKSLRNLGITPYRALLAQQYSIYGFTELSTLGYLARQKQIPIKKLREFVGVKSTDKSRDQQSLQSFNKTPEDMVDFENKFKEGKLGYGLYILLWGVSFVFSALAITAVAIGQLRRLNREPKKGKADLVLDSAGNVKTKAPDLDVHVIAAVIAAFHIHKQSIEERRRLLLTFKRPHSDQWRGSAILNMPNRHILRKRSK
ncbi:MAG: OadG family protein [Candidatus Cloacimonadaceae bacterium]|jgi:Na+-transporting methylmalonyl-CoA/oxaloacetate decarboxylase gamma subunit|nr:OadG family protein [Candidatus Cloacimonadota bacterium]MDX9949253.1 OadG family protein [Candidatus Syntrophosphaera sp.]